MEISHIKFTFESKESMYPYDTVQPYERVIKIQNIDSIQSYRD